jgi:hypothetical protein
MFERENENESVLVTVNRTENECKINVPSFYEKSDKVYTLKKSNSKVLDSYGALALKKG